LINGETTKNAEDEKYVRITICGADLLNIDNIHYYLLSHYIIVKLNKTDIYKTNISSIRGMNPRWNFSFEIPLSD
jgi:hypothetical protein